MAHVTLESVNAWSEKTKLDLTELDTALESQVSTNVLGQLGTVYDVSGWTSDASTPQIVQDVISMFYAGYYYLRTYSEDEDTSNYGMFLIRQAQTLLSGLIAGTIAITELPTSDVGQPAFYPTDASSAQCPTREDPSLGGAKFSMGTIF